MRDNVTTKKCGCCEAEKPISQFRHFLKRGIPSVSFRCIDCLRQDDRERSRKKRIANGLEIYKGTTRICHECGVSYTVRSWRNKYCSDACRQEVNRRNALEISHQKTIDKGAIRFGTEIKCHHCGIEFKKDHPIVKYCKECRILQKRNKLPHMIEARLKWYEKNKEELASKNKLWREANKDFLSKKGKERSKKRYQENKEKEKERIEKYRNSEQGKKVLSEFRRRYDKERKANDPVYALMKRTQSNIRRCIRDHGFTKKSRTHEILGCDWETFKKHIERQFLKGMGWSNSTEWHLDHIIPMATAKTENDVLRLNHYLNLRPLWARENIIKRDQILYLI